MPRRGTQSSLGGSQGPLPSQGAPPAPTSGGYAGGAPAGGPGQGMYGSVTQSSITPQGVQPYGLTRQTMNQQLADAHQRGNLQHLMAQGRRPGIRGNSQGIQYKAQPQQAQAYAQGANNAMQTYLGDMFANRQNYLGGELARALESINAANTGNQIAQSQNDYMLGRNQIGQNWLVQALGALG